MIKAETPIVIQKRELVQGDELASGELLLSLRETLDDNQATEEKDRLVLGLDSRHGNPNFDRVVTPYTANELLTEGSPRVRELFSQTVRDENRLAFAIPTVVRYHPTEWVEAKSAKYDGGYASSIMFEDLSVATKIEYQAFIDGMPVRVGTLRVLAGPGAIQCKDSWSLDFDQPEIEFTIRRESDQFVLLARLQNNNKLTLMVRRANIARPPERVAPNLPPVWVTGPDLGLVTGPRTLVATDPEGYPVTYQSNNLPNGVSLNFTTGELTLNNATAGDYTFIVDASDGVLNTRREFTMRINNMPVWVTPAGSIGIFQTNAPMTFQLVATDADNDPLTYTVIAGALPSGLTMNSAGMISGSPTGDGSFTVRVSDGVTSVDRQFSLDANAAPVWVTPAGSIGRFNTGSAVSFQFAAQDADNDPLVYSAVTSLPAGFNLSPSGLLSGTAGPQGSFTLRVADPNGYFEDRSFSIASNATPVWVTPAGSLGLYGTGSSVTIQLEATDADNDPLTYSVVSGTLPAGLTMNSSGSITGTANGDGTFTVRVTDGMTPVDRQFSLSSNAPPIWVTPAGSIGKWNIGTTMSFQFSAQDPDNDTLVYSVAPGFTIPTGLTLSPSGLLSGTANLERTFSLRVTDPNGEFADRSFTVEVNVAPVWVTAANAVGPYAVGSYPSYQLVATDNDNDPLTYTLVSGAPPRNMSVSATALLSGGPIMPVTPEQLEFPISANTLIEVFINDVQTTNFTVNGQPYNPPVSTGSNWTFISPPPANALSPADSSYMVTYGADTYFKSKPLEAPFITDGSDFIPVPGQTYTVTYTIRKIVKETNGVQSCFRPAFDARLTNGTDMAASGAKYGFGYDPSLDFIFTDDWVLNQFYTVNASWTAPAGSYQYARGRIRVNRTPIPGESWTDPPTFSNAVFEIKSSEISQGAQRPKSTVFVPAPSSNAVVRVVTRAISNPVAIVDNLTHNHFPVTSETNSFTMRVADPSNLTANRTFTVNTFAPDLPAGEAYVVTTTAEYDAATAPGNAPPSQEEIFNSWARFDGATFYPTGTPPGGQATEWTYSNGTIKSTVNSGALIGFVSPNDVSNYTHGVTMSSTNADDDSIAVVVAFALVNNVANSLIAVRACGGNTPSWGLVHFAGTSATVLVNGDSVAGVAAGSPGWQGKGPSRVEVTRNGNQVSIVCSQMGNLVIDESTRLNYTIPENSPFAGPKPYGYAARSQADATFSNIAMSGGLDATVVYDGRTMPPKVMVYNFTTQTWEQDLSRSIFRDHGYPRNLTNPATGNTFRLTGPRPYSVTKLP